MQESIRKWYCDLRIISFNTRLGSTLLPLETGTLLFTSSSWMFPVRLVFRAASRGSTCISSPSNNSQSTNQASGGIFRQALARMNLVLKVVWITRTLMSEKLIFLIDPRICTPAF